MANLRRLLPLAAALLLAIGAGPAQALSVTDIAIATTAANTADEFGNAGANRIQIESSAGLLGAAPAPVADVAGASLGFETRYASLLAVDREAGGGTTTRSATASYTITFTVDNPTGGVYRIDVDTRRLGALTLVDDGGGSASASLGAVSALLDEAPQAALALPAAAPLSGAGGGNLEVHQASPTLRFVESGTSRTYTLAFTWEASASSSQDETAVRLGLPGGLTSTAADDYPGVGARIAADDGHFVRIGVTLMAIPEPGTLALVALGLLPLVARRRGSAA